MSDDFPGYFTAWTEVFGEPQHHLLCSWHVFKNWNKHLNSIKDNELRLSVKTDLFHLQKVLDTEEFSRLFRFFKEKYSAIDNSKHFVDYLVSYYENRVEQWGA